MIQVNGIQASLDFIIASDLSHPSIISFYDRSQAVVRSIGASIANDTATYIATDDYKYVALGVYDVIISPIVTGKDKFYHGLAISKALNKEIMVCRDGDQEISFYNFLMHNYNYPLMKEWAGELYSWMLGRGYIRCDERRLLVRGSNSVSEDLMIGYGRIRLSELRAYHITLSEHILENCIQTLFRARKIWISPYPQEKLSFTNMDSYFKMYGRTLVENLEKTIQPLTELNGNMDDFVMRNMRLFPQQAAQVNGVLKLLERSSYAILNEGMGTGKTAQGAGICEAFFVRKFLKSNPGKTLRDAYLQEGVIKYRNIVMCPGHLVAKWADHIRKEIPYARVTILNDFSQLLEIKKRGIERTCREFYVISKDFAKLSYQSKPIPKERRYGHLMKKVCGDCGEEVNTIGRKCNSCGSTKIILERSGYKGQGMVCPHCKNILIPYKTAKLYPWLDEGEYTVPLDFDDFTNQCEANSQCYYCDGELWEPHVANLGETSRTNTWYRATHYANKAHKGKKTVWVHKKYASQYFESIGEEPLNEIDSDVYRGVRKVAPGVYIKKQLKGFFDFAIFDEVHLFKSGSSAQANCMSALIASSKKHLALTGTIAGGMASHIFYLIYRLDPRRMQKAGYKWTDEMKFAEKYGVIEKRFECRDDSNVAYNTSSKGRQKGSPTQKPGISPLIFMDFLLDKTVFLDLSDLSRYLPPLKEIIELVDIEPVIETNEGDVVENPEKEMLLDYNHVISVLKQLTREKEGGKGILSTMLQFSLSYLDKPYDIPPIKSPKSGSVLVHPASFPMYKDPNILLSKEKRLIDIVKKEQAEGRNVVIYAEFTGSPETCVSYRLKELLEIHCGLRGKVEIIESSYPPAAKREEWMHKKAEEGIKVFITNPRNVETGLDFCFIRNGKLYNYPTLIYYQMGYSLFTIWQSSRRHYRLNQREECRTYYIAIRCTIQQAVIQLIAEKMVATSAIQGKFSTEGLTALANGIDAKVKLAQALANMDETAGSDLQGMFDVINQEYFDDTKYANYRPMITLKELLGNADPVEKIFEEMNELISPDEMMNVFDVFENFLNDFTERHDDVIFEPMINVFSNKPNLPKTSSRKKAVAGSEQPLLF